MSFIWCFFMLIWSNNTLDILVHITLHHLALLFSCRTWRRWRPRLSLLIGRRSALTPTSTWEPSAPPLATSLASSRRSSRSCTGKVMVVFCYFCNVVQNIQYYTINRLWHSAGYNKNTKCWLTFFSSIHIRDTELVIVRTRFTLPWAVPPKLSCAKIQKQEYVGHSMALSK